MTLIPHICNVSNSYFGTEGNRILSVVPIITGEQSSIIKSKANILTVRRLFIDDILRDNTDFDISVRSLGVGSGGGSTEILTTIM